MQVWAYVCMNDFLHVCMCIMCMPEEGSDLLELDFQTGLSCQMYTWN